MDQSVCVCHSMGNNKAALNCDPGSEAIRVGEKRNVDAFWCVAG
jgi:hypothetical protein